MGVSITITLPMLSENEESCSTYSAKVKEDMAKFFC